MRRATRFRFASCESDGQVLSLLLVCAHVLGQLAPPDPRLLLVESATIAIRLCRSPLSARTVSDAFRAASTTLALRTGILDLLRDRISQASDDDDTLLVLRDSARLLVCPLSFVFRLRAHAGHLPEAVVLNHRPEYLLRRHFLRSEGPAHLRDCLRRRLTHLFAYDVADGEMDLVMARLEWIFRDLPCSSHLRRCASLQLCGARLVVWRALRPDVCRVGWRSAGTTCASIWHPPDWRDALPSAGVARLLG